MSSEQSPSPVDYYKLHGFYHTVIRNIGLTLSISLALMTLNRYWRGKHKYISVLTYFIATIFLCISVYINITLINELDVHIDKLEDGEARMFERWAHVSKFVIVAQCITSVVYGYIGRSICSELKVFGATKGAPSRSRSRRSRR